MQPYALAAQHRFKSPGAGSYVVGLASAWSEGGGGAVGSRLVASVAGSQGSLEVLSLAGLRPECSIPAPHGKEAPSDLAFLRGAPCIVSCGADGAVKLWDVRARGREPARMLREAGAAPKEDEQVTSVSVSSDDRLCAYALGSKIRVLDLTAGKELFVHEEAHCEPITCLRFHPSRARELVSAGDDGLICVLDAERCIEGGKAIEDDSGLRLVVNGGETTRSLSFIGEDSEVVAAVSTTEVVQLWSLHEQRPGGFCGRFPNLRASPSLRVGESDGYIVDVLYDQASGRAHALGGSVSGALSLFHLNLEASELAVSLPSGGHGGVVRGAAALGAAVGGGFATGGEDGKICLWRPAAGGSEGGARKRPGAAGGWRKSKKRAKGSG
mmetsp:Transcript_105661/g.268430  ORF Transcript_105661/g.268430 Transcript_105661/m.268430 type:complete len:383 (-) Transcript_105661:40-1188(-)